MCLVSAKGKLFEIMTKIIYQNLAQTLRIKKGSKTICLETLTGVVTPKGLLHVPIGAQGQNQSITTFAAYNSKSS